MRGCQDATLPPPNHTTNRKTSVQFTIPRIIPAPHSFFVDLNGWRPISLKGRFIKHFHAMIGIMIIMTSVRISIATGRQASLTSWQEVKNSQPPDWDHLWLLILQSGQSGPEKMQNTAVRNKAASQWEWSIRSVKIHFCFWILFWILNCSMSA